MKERGEKMKRKDEEKMEKVRTEREESMKKMKRKDEGKEGKKQRKDEDNEEMYLSPIVRSSPTASLVPFPFLKPNCYSSNCSSILEYKRRFSIRRRIFAKESSSLSWQFRRELEGTKAALTKNDISIFSSELKEVHNETATSLEAKQRRSVLKESKMISLMICAQKILRTPNMVKDEFTYNSFYIETATFEVTIKHGDYKRNRDGNKETLKPSFLQLSPASRLFLAISGRSHALYAKQASPISRRAVILPVVLYGCETWTLTLREEHRLRVFENKVLRKIFGAKRVEVTGEWRKLHNAELHALYSSPDIIRNIKSRRLRWAGHVARMGESRNAYRVLVGRPEGKRPLGRPRGRWEDNIKMDLREVGYDDRDWIDFAQDRDLWRAYVRTAMNLRVP
ncbi:hypothetical protein ANN_22316 [Periplaneta americana]|uniref:Uncharacterized protein n=1 Tax=Periplaneta americana TaxID=6978 RepID=A0ABQ8S7X2_PERAM|nr:hypothetical protein ANN_22316 [Periplaneta americana]